MGKKQARLDANRVAFSNKEDASIIIAAFDKSTNADQFAMVTQGFDRHRLRIFSTLTGNVTHDYAAENKERFTSLAWGKLKNDTPVEDIVALGTHLGTIIIYSLAQGSIVKRLEGAHVTPVMDFIMNRAGTKGYSVAEDNYIVEWDLEQGQEIARWRSEPKNTRKLQLNHDETKIAAAGHAISFWDTIKGVWYKKCVGHTNEVSSLIFSERDDLLASVGKNDRYISVWDAQANDVINNLTTLTLENSVIHLDFSVADPTLLAVTDDGVVGIWQNASSASTVPTGSAGLGARRKIIRALTRHTDASVRIQTESQKPIPIILARFVVGADGRSIMIARGSSVKPVFEIVPYTDEAGVLKNDVTLVRKQVTNVLLNKETLAEETLQSPRRYNESSTAVVGRFELPVAAAQLSMPDEKTIAEKLGDLSFQEESAEEGEDEEDQKLKPMTPTTPKKAPIKDSAGSLQQALVQALHSGDKNLLEDCFDQLRKLDPIRQTIRRLPSVYVIPLLEEVIRRFQGKPGRGQHMLRWIHIILVTHTSYLLTVPDLVGKLSGLYQTLDTRASAFPKLQELYGYVDILDNQIKSATTLGEQQVARSVYVEEDSDYDEQVREQGSIMSTDSESENELDQDDLDDDDLMEDDEDDLIEAY